MLHFTEVTLSIDLSDEALRALGDQPEQAAAELRMAAAAKLYELGRLSSGAAAELAGVPRVAFLSRLAEFGVSVLDATPEEIARDASRA